MIKVRKYNKKLQPFDVNKITESIKAAADKAKEELPIKKIEKIVAEIQDELNLDNVEVISTEGIAEIVEKALMNSSYKDTAKSFITYRHDKQQEHVYNSDLIKAFKKKLSGAIVENSNANSDERSFSGRMNEASRVLLKDDALGTMSKKAKSNHINNRIYIHDLDSYSSGQHNCLSIPFDPILKNGVAIKQTDIRQPKSIGTALQLIAVLKQVQSLQQYGGVSATHIDWTLVPYVRYSLVKNLAEVIAYDKDIEDDKIIRKKIYNKILSANKIPYSTLRKKAYDEAIFSVFSDSNLDFIAILDKISEEIMSEKVKEGNKK